MRIQTPLILFFVFVFSLALQAQDEKAVRKATDEFMTAMKKLGRPRTLYINRLHGDSSW